MKHCTLSVGDLVEIGVRMVLEMGHGQPVKFKLRGRVSCVVDEGVEIRLLDDIPMLNNYPLRVPAEMVPLALTKLDPPGR